jgi:hypothetical protein
MTPPLLMPSFFARCRVKRLSLSLFLAVVVIVLGAGCESMRCYTCPDARNQAAPPSARA